MTIQFIEYEEQFVWPIMSRDQDGMLIIRLYDEGDIEGINCDSVAYREIDLVELPPEVIQVARNNWDIMQDQDLITLKPPLATGILWEVDPDNPLQVIDPQTGDVICTVELSDKAEANARIIAASRHLLNVVQGVYYRMTFHEGMYPSEKDAQLIEMLIDSLRQAGVENVDDIDCKEYIPEIDDEGEAEGPQTQG